jgi:hypothetical protein
MFYLSMRKVVWLRCQAWKDHTDHEPYAAFAAMQFQLPFVQFHDFLRNG